MGWFGGKKKKAKKSAPVLEPVGNTVNTAVPAVQAAPAVQATPAVQAAPAVQATPAVQAAPAVQPVVEIAPVGAVADTNISVTTDTNKNKNSNEWSKKSNKPLFDIHKKLDYMMDSKGKSLEDRYNERFGDKLPESVAADSARKEYNEKKATQKDKPKIVFKQKSQLKLTPKKESKKESKIETSTKKETKEDVAPKSKQILTKTGSVVGRSADVMKSSIGKGAGAVKSGIGKGTSAVKSSFGKGAGAVKSGFSRSTSAIKGLFSKNKNEKTEDKSPEVKDYKKMKVADLKDELKEKGLSTAGKKADLIKRLES